MLTRPSCASMDVLADLESLAAFVGTRVPLSSPNPQLLPLLTHPSHTTFPWAPLRIALESFFGTPDAIDPARVQGGWAGLRCYIAAFKRLEAVDSEAETAEVMTWLLALKDAAIQTRSVYCSTSFTVLYVAVTDSTEFLVCSVKRPKRTCSTMSSLVCTLPSPPRISLLSSLELGKFSSSSCNFGYLRRTIDPTPHRSPLGRRSHQDRPRSNAEEMVPSPLPLPSNPLSRRFFLDPVLKRSLQEHPRSIRISQRPSDRKLPRLRS